MISKLYLKFLSIPDSFVRLIGPKRYSAGLYVSCIKLGSCGKKHQYQCIKIETIRSIFHFVGALVVLFLVNFFKLPLIFVYFFLSFILFQELYLHPKYFNQPKWKGRIDILSWGVPMIVFILW